MTYSFSRSPCEDDLAPTLPQGGLVAPKAPPSFAARGERPVCRAAGVSLPGGDQHRLAQVEVVDLAHQRALLLEQRTQIVGDGDLLV